MLNTSTLPTPKDSILPMQNDSEKIAKLEDTSIFTSILKVVTKEDKNIPSQDLGDLAIKSTIKKDISKELFLLLDLIKSDEGLDELLDFIQADEDLADLLQLVKLDNVLDDNLLLNLSITDGIKIKKTLENIQEKLQTKEVKTLKQLFFIANEKGLRMTKLSVKTLSKNNAISQKDKEIFQKEEKKATTLRDLIQTSKNLPKQEVRQNILGKNELKQDVLDKNELGQDVLDKNELGQDMQGEASVQSLDKSINDDNHLHTMSNINSTSSIDMQKQSQLLDTRSIKNLVEDLKEHINKFKSPLMKVSLEINPNNMGKLEVEIISRGNNLYLNFNSNQQAISMVMNNLEQFKNSLNDMGFSDVQMSFSSNNNSNSDNQNHQDMLYQNIDEVIEDDIEEVDNFNLKLPIYF